MMSFLFVLLFVGIQDTQSGTFSNPQPSVSYGAFSLHTTMPTSSVYTPSSLLESNDDNYSVGELHLSSAQLLNSYGMQPTVSDYMTISSVSARPSNNYGTVTAANLLRNTQTGSSSESLMRKYQAYCDACAAAGVRPLPFEAWNNGQWEGVSNAYHPKSPGVTGHENEYWEQHDVGTPVGELYCLIIIELLYTLLFIIRKQYKKHHLKHTPSSKCQVKPTFE